MTIPYTAVPLYRPFSDEEPLDIIRREAEELDRLPCKKSLFCVYREFILWPGALEAAFLRASRAEQHAGFPEAWKKAREEQA